MMKTLAISAAAAMGLMLMPIQATSTAAAPAIAPKIATPDSVVEQVRRHGGGGFRTAGSGYRGGIYRGGFRGGRYAYGGRHYHRGRYHRHGRHWRRGVVIGAGIPFFYSGYGYYSGCGYYYRKWQRTGSRYWRNRYYACRWW